MYTRMFLYIAIAVFTTVISETTKSDLPVFWAVSLAASLQGLIAWRAFIDETPAYNKKNQELSALSHSENQKVE